MQDLTLPDTVRRLVDTALSRFGRLDAACIRTGKIITGDFLDSSLEDLETLMSANVTAVFHALQALLPPLVKAGGGQVLIVTSATGAADPAVREQIEAMVPLRRLGRPDEVAHFCASLLDGGNTFQTGQFFSMSGGWSD